EQNFRFASGHWMGSIIGYGLLAYVLVLLLPWRRAKAAVVVALAVLILGIGFSRIYLGAHWLTDVIGGFTLGACWLAVCVAILETFRRRPARRDSAPAREGAAIVRRHWRGAGLLCAPPAGRGGVWGVRAAQRPQ